MSIDATDFGSITVDGRRYDHDVVIHLSGQVEKRRKELSKAVYGTSHIISKDEARSIFEKGCELLIVGAGQQGNVRLSPQADAYFGKKGCRVKVLPTPQAIESFNRSHERTIGLMHVTC